MLKNWGQGIETDQLPRHFNGGPQNIGLILGARSGGLTDIDLDCPEALGIAPYILPPTHAIFGRASKPASHWLYVTDLAEKRAKAVDQYEDVDGTMLVEQRMGGGGKAAQTVVPPSRHPSGEIVRWDEAGEPAKVDGDDLDRQVRLLATAVLLARHWPLEVDLAFTWAAIGRRLADAGASASKIALLAEGIAKVLGVDWKAARLAAVGVAESFDGPSLREAFGAGVAERIDRFLGDGEAIEDQPEAGAEATFDRPASHRERAWAQAALKKCAAEIAATGKGSRNTNLNRVAHRLGGMVARGWLERNAVEHDLLEAAHTNGMVKDDGGADRALATIRSGLDAGMQQPHADLPDHRDDGTDSETGEDSSYSKGDARDHPTRANQANTAGGARTRSGAS
jgi:hypothetical protein